MSRILIVESEPAVRRELIRALDRDCDVLTAASGADALQALDGPRIDAAFIDLELPDQDGLDLFRAILEVDPRMAVIAVSSRDRAETGVAALKAGAVDYLVKPLDLPRAAAAARQAIRMARIESQAERWRRLRRQLGDGSSLVARSPAMIEVLDLVDRVAPTTAAVLLTGESGTGKDLIARRIHHLSPRRDRGFIAINCAGLPGPLLESEMFGHERGAFTGADEARRGLFEAADGGTLFLDEIGDMPANLQAKLLRALEDGTFLRVGGRHTLRSHVRLISATNQDLRRLLDAGQFRDDLYWRINTVQIEPPPLRTRPQDVPELVSHFLATFGKSIPEPPISPEALRALEAYDWPGNVRELRNVIERAVILSGPDPVQLHHLPDLMTAQAPRPEPAGAAAQDPGRLARAVAACERQTIAHALGEHRGNRALTATALGISLRTLHYKLRRLGLS